MNSIWGVKDNKANVLGKRLMNVFKAIQKIICFASPEAGIASRKAIFPMLDVFPRYANIPHKEVVTLVHTIHFPLKESPVTSAWPFA